MTRDEKNHQAYLDVMDQVDPTMEDDEYLESYYGFKRRQGPDPHDGETEVEALFFM